MANLKPLIVAAALLVTGCTTSSDSIVKPSDPADRSVVQAENVTFYVGGMNQRLQIL